LLHRAHVDVVAPSSPRLFGDPEAAACLGYAGLHQH